MIKEQPADLPWLYTEPVQPPTVIQHWDGLATVTLSKLPDGTARLMWVFDEDYPIQLGLFVHLTDEEAQVVFDTPPETGLLERVRQRLYDSLALLWSTDARTMRAKFVEIPGTGTDEDSFWASLWAESEKPYPWSVDMVNPPSGTRDAARLAFEVRERTLAGAC